MHRQLMLLFVCLGWVCLTAVTASARIIENWPYQRLLKEADLVVIATATSSKQASDTFRDERWPLKFEGQNTTFQVLQALKGKHDGNQIVLLHYKFATPEKGQGAYEIIDGPSFLSFRIKSAPLEIAGHDLSDHKFEYLLFLKKRNDGRYEPVSGQIDPDLSVRELFPPFFSRETGE